MLTKDDIISLPNKHLRQKSKAVQAVDESIKKIVDNMVSATMSWDESREHEVGVALAAVQIDKLVKIIIVREDFDDKKNINFQVFINPEILSLSGDLVEDYEGCLSVPNIYGKVPRYSKVKVKAKNLEGQSFTVTAKNFTARVLQHEIDHTDGKVFIDKIKDRKDAFYILTDEGKLEQLDYEKDIKENSILWK